MWEYFTFSVLWHTKITISDILQPVIGEIIIQSINNGNRFLAADLIKSYITEQCVSEHKQKLDRPMLSTPCYYIKAPII